MRITQLFLQLAARGGEKVAFDLGRNFVELGHDTTNLGFWYRDETRSAASDAFELLTPGRSGPVGIAQGMWRLVRRLRDDDTEALLMHSTAGALLGAVAGAIAGVRRRVVIHHNPLGTYHSELWSRIDGLWGLLGLYTDVVFISEGGVASAAKLPSRYRERITLILNGVDPLPRQNGRDFRREFEMDDATPLVVSVGSLTEQKNHLLAVASLAAVAPAPVYAIAGAGHLEPQLRAAADQSGVQLRLIGHVGATEVGDLLAQSDLFLFPSMHEGRPLTLLEAAHAGVPILASDIPENVATLGSAADYFPLEAETLAARLQSLLGNPGELAALRHRARSTDVTSTRTMAERYLELLSTPR